jgi:hypothetical protein
MFESTYWHSRASYKFATAIQSEPSPPKQPPRWLRRHAAALGIIIMLAVLFGGIGAIALNCEINIVNSTFSVQPGNYVSYSFSESSTSRNGVYGGFSSNSPISMYLMNASQFASFTSTKTANSSMLSVGPVSSYNIPEIGCPKACVSTVFVQQGTYYLVFNNPSNSVLATVTITQPMHADSCG